ncbi:hypothetical protein GMJAKD_10815 [Candidatus Electrothrix aarhusensis]
MDKKEFFKKYGMYIYIVLFLLSIIFLLVGHYADSVTIKSVALNLSAGCLYVVFVEFLVINKVSLLFETSNARQDAREARKEEKITVMLSHGAQSLELPVELRRMEFTRAEILGRIRMMPRKEKDKPFQLSYTGTREFLQQINQIAENEGDATMTIPCNEEEFLRFKNPGD